MVIRDNSLQLEVNKVLWIQRALFLLDFRLGTKIRVIYISSCRCGEHKREEINRAVAATWG